MSLKFGEFDIAHGCWKNYIERFLFGLEANGIESDSLKKANLVAVCGPNLYDLITSLIAPLQVSEVSFTLIKTRLDNHFHPTPNEIVQSYKFHTRNQLEGEMIRDYIAQLRKLTIGCNFTDLSRTLRDRLVCGIIDKDIKKKLLQQSQLTFEQACEIAVSCETANKDTDLIVTSGPSNSNTTNMEFDEPMDVNKISTKRFNKQTDKPNCFRCGKKHGNSCRFRWSKCNFCGKIGHIEAACMSKSTNSNCNGLYEEDVNYVREHNIAAFKAKIRLNGHEIDMEVDSGCAFTLICEKTARLIWKGKLPEFDTVDVALKTWTNNKLNLLGKTKVQVQYKGLRKNLSIYIAEGNGPSLIGRNWFTDLNIQMQGVYNLKN